MGNRVFYCFLSEKTNHGSLWGNMSRNGMIILLLTDLALKVPKKSQMHTSFCHRGQGVPCSDSFLCTWHGHCRGGWFGCCSYHVSTLTWRFPGGQGAGPTYGQPSHARLRKIVAGTRGGQCWAWQSWQCAMVKRETCGATRCDQIYPNARTLIQLQVLAFTLPKRGPCRHGCLLEQDVSSARLMLCDANFNRLTSYHPPWMKSQVRCREMECAWPEDWRSS